MKTSVICTVVLAAFGMCPAAHAAVPRGPDAINGAFVRMLARADDAPARPILQGKPDPIALMFVAALGSQRVDAQRLALRDQVARF